MRWSIPILRMILNKKLANILLYKYQVAKFYQFLQKKSDPTGINLFDGDTQV